MKKENASAIYLGLGLVFGAGTAAYSLTNAWTSDNERRALWSQESAIKRDISFPPEYEVTAARDIVSAFASYYHVTSDERMCGHMARTTNTDLDNSCNVIKLAVEKEAQWKEIVESKGILQRLSYLDRVINGWLVTAAIGIGGAVFGVVKADTLLNEVNSSRKKS